MTSIDFILCGIALALFGAVLVIGFTNPVVTTETLAVQRASVFIPDAYNMAIRDQFYSPAVTIPNTCTCPVNAVWSCVCQGGNYLISVGGGGTNLTFNTPNLFFDGNVNITAGVSVIITAPLRIAGSLTLQSGSLTINSPISVAGPLLLQQGSLTGTAFCVSVPGHQSVSFLSVTLLNGNINVPECPASFAGVSGLITINSGNFVSSNSFSVILPTVRDLTTVQTRGLIHAGGTVKLRESRVAVVGATTATSFSFVVASSDSALPESFWSTVDYDVAEYNKDASRGGCASSFVNLVTTPGSNRATMRYEMGPCNGTIVTPPSTTPNEAVMKELQFDLASDAITVPTNGFAQSNCYGADQYGFELESAYVATLRSASFDTSFWSFCPENAIIVDKTTRCISYVCNGTVTLSRSALRDTNRQIQENILQSIVFDAIATGLEVLAVILEFFVIPLVAFKVV